MCGFINPLLVESACKRKYIVIVPRACRSFPSVSLVPRPLPLRPGVLRVAGEVIVIYFFPSVLPKGRNTPPESFLALRCHPGTDGRLMSTCWGGLRCYQYVWHSSTAVVPVFDLCQRFPVAKKGGRVKSAPPS